MTHGRPVKPTPPTIARPGHEATVKAHVSRLPTKLGVTNRVQMAIVVHDAEQT